MLYCFVLCLVLLQLLHPRAGKIPWRRGWLPTPVFWPGEFHGLYSPWCCRESQTRLSDFHVHFPPALCSQDNQCSSFSDRHRSCCSGQGLDPASLDIDTGKIPGKGIDPLVESLGTSLRTQERNTEGPSGSGAMEQSTECIIRF